MTESTDMQCKTWAASGSGENPEPMWLCDFVILGFVFWEDIELNLTDILPR